MFAQLGDIVFDGVLGPEQMSMTGDETYAKHALINRKPNLVHTGSDLRTISMCIQFHFSFCTPEISLQQLWAHKEAADILTLVFGNGRVVGHFVIVSMTETPIQTGPDGTYICAKANVNLVEVDLSGKQSSVFSQAAKDKAIALSQNGVTPVRSRSREFTNAKWKAIEALFTANSVVAATANLVKHASVPEFWALTGLQLGSYCAVAINAHSDAIAALGIDPSIALLCPDLPAAIVHSASTVADLKTASEPIVSYSDLLAKQLLMKTGVADMMAKANKLMFNIIMRIH